MSCLAQALVIVQEILILQERGGAIDTKMGDMKRDSQAERLVRVPMSSRLTSSVRLVSFQKNNCVEARRRAAQPQK